MKVLILKRRIENDLLSLKLIQESNSTPGELEGVFALGPREQKGGRRGEKETRASVIH